MKLQLSPQALRLRLSEAELPVLSQSGRLTQVLDLGPGQRLIYTLQQLPDDAPAAGLQVRYAADALTVELPATLARQLTSGAAVSVRGELMGTDGRLVRIIVEKDLGPSH